jgi:hypothetical protein
MAERMLPAFNREGNLPEGIHLATEDEVLWLDTYQTGKDFTRRGIVEVIVA